MSAINNSDFFYQYLADTDERPQSNLIRNNNNNDPHNKQIKRKDQGRRLVSLLFALIVISALVAIIYYAASNSSTNSSNSNSSNSGASSSNTVNNDIVVTDTVLPNTTLNISVISDSKSNGQISYFSTQLPHKLTFDWLSLYNITHDVVKFELTSKSKTDLMSSTGSSAYLSEFNGISGFEIDLNANDLSTDGDTSDTSDSSYYMIIYVFEFDKDDASMITLEEDSDGNELVLSDDETVLLSDLVNGFIGEYFVELGIKLGSLNYIGNDYKSIQFIYQYSQLFFRIASQNGTNNWDFTMLDDAIDATNSIVSGGNQTQATQTMDTAETLQQRRLGSCQLTDTCGNECYGMCGDECSCWWWVCGGCGCYEGCRDHDYYCSCVSFWSWGCFNIFSFGCNGY